MSNSILFLCGSLRADSFNKKVMSVAAKALPKGYHAEFFDLAAIPPYNADHDGADAPASVLALREAISSADGVFWSTPEYNYALPGLVKNVIDWASRPMLPQNCVVGKPMNALVTTMSATNGVRSLTELKRYWGHLGGFSVPQPDCVITQAGAKISVVDGEVIMEPAALQQVALAIRVLVNIVETDVSGALEANWAAVVASLSS